MKKVRISKNLNFIRELKISTKGKEDLINLVGQLEHDIQWALPDQDFYNANLNIFRQAYEIPFKDLKHNTFNSLFDSERTHNNDIDFINNWVETGKMTKEDVSILSKLFKSVSNKSHYSFKDSITTKKEEAISILQLLQQALLVFYKAINGKTISVPFNREKYNLHDVKKHFEIKDDTFVVLPDNDKDIDEINNALSNHKNILIIGAAGTGKTTIIKNICKKFQDKGISFMVCAPTNNAARLIGEGFSKTINSVFKFNVKKTIQQFNNWDRSKNNIAYFRTEHFNTQIFIIDEISMISSNTMNLIDYICRQAFDQSRPFGGKRFILVGDPYQLPPIFTEIDEKIFHLNKEKRYFFDSEAFQQGSFHPIVLKKIYRQQDAKFLKFLNDVRIAKITNEDENYVKEVLGSEEREEQGIFIVARNKQVDKITNENMNKLEGEFITYKQKNEFMDQELLTEYFGKIDFWKLILKVSSVKQEVSFKEGSQVMAIATPRDRSYTKNQIGTIKELHNNYAMVMFDGVLTKVDYLDTEEVDENNRILYRIKYFPLIPAYAFTCHRAQGMTLKELTVDCENIFEDGQMYVALSRAVHPDGLTILHWDSKLIKTNSHVDGFVRKLLVQN